MSAFFCELSGRSLRQRVHHAIHRRMVAVLHLDPMLRPAGLIGPLPMLRELDDANAAWLRTVGAKVLGKTLSQRYYYHLLCPHPEGVMMIKVSLVLAAVIAAVPCTAQEVRVFSGGEQHVYGPGVIFFDSPGPRATTQLSSTALVRSGSRQ